MAECIFCSITRGEAAASVIYQDDDFMAIMDAYPLTKGHVLIIPKQHRVLLHELSKAQRSQLFNLGHAIMQAQTACGLARGGVNMLLNDGSVANQTIAHLHLHLIPRRRGDLVKALPKLLLHTTGVFGIKSKPFTLDEQAQLINEHLIV